MTIKEIIRNKLNRDEILRYLQAKNEVPKFWNDMIDEIIEEVMALISPNYIAIEDTIVINENILEMPKTGFEIVSKDLSGHLRQSKKIWIVIATLGHAIERKIKYHFTANPTRAVIMDACGSAIIEAYCDAIEDELSTSLNIPFFTSRFSPGYGDLSLDYQKMIFDHFGVTKKTGVHLSSGYLMIPQKSVLFIIGDTDKLNVQMGCQHKCATCQLETCIYRMEGI